MEEVQSNAQQYRTRYMQTHVERVEQALTLARDELWATFEMDQERQQYLDGLVADQRAYVRQLESDLAEYQAAVSKAEGVSVREAQETLGGNMELAFRGWDAAAGYRGDNAQRRVDSMKLHQQEWNTPAAAQRVLAGVTEDVSEVMIQALSAGDVDRAVMAMLSDDRVLSVYQQMGVGSSQARAFGVDVMRAVTDATKKARDDQGRPVTTDVHAIQRAVGQQLGLRPEDVDPTIFEADKARAREQMIRESQAGGIIALEEFAARLEARAVEEQQRAVREREAGRAGSPAQELVNDAEAWSYIRADLADNGALDMSNQPEQMQRNREALIEHSDLQRRYQDARTTADTLPQRDQQWFDDLFLQRIGTLGGARAELSRLQTERAGVRPLAPTEEMVRQRAGGIYAPERRRPLVQTPAERAEFQQQTAALQQRGSPGAVRQAGLAAEDWRAKFDALPDDRKILSAQVLRATALPADHRADVQAQHLYQQVKNGTLQKDRIVAVVSDLAKGDMQRRDDLIRDVNWLLMQDWRATRFVPETPPAPEEPARPAPE